MLWLIDLEGSMHCINCDVDKTMDGEMGVKSLGAPGVHENISLRTGGIYLLCYYFSPIFE